MTDPKKTAQADVATTDEGTSNYGSIEFDGVEYAIVHKPNTLMISEMSRIGSDDPEAIGIIAEFFEVTLGDNYKAFRKAAYRSPNGTDERLAQLLQEVVEKSLGRPTQ
jgi:hypothetical protein